MAVQVKQIENEATLLDAYRIDNEYELYVEGDEDECLVLEPVNRRGATNGEVCVALTFVCSVVVSGLMVVAHAMAINAVTF